MIDKISKEVICDCKKRLKNDLNIISLDFCDYVKNENLFNSDLSFSHLLWNYDALVDCWAKKNVSNNIDILLDFGHDYFDYVELAEEELGAQSDCLLFFEYGMFLRNKEKLQDDFYTIKNILYCDYILQNYDNLNLSTQDYFDGVYLIENIEPSEPLSKIVDIVKGGAQNDK